MIRLMITQEDEVVYSHQAGFASYRNKGEIGFTNYEDVDYFIKHFNGKMHDYKEAMDPSKSVEFCVYLKTPNGEYQDN
jgi:tetrahydromethanopterin S-methyltransferase subunit B